MNPTLESDEYLSGKEAGLNEAALLVEQAVVYGKPMQWALFALLDAADRVNAARTLRFDECEMEFVQRA